MANLNKVMLIGRLTRDPEPIMVDKGAKFGFASLFCAKTLLFSGLVVLAPINCAAEKHPVFVFYAHNFRYELKAPLL